ncbi:ARM repeat-containing protein [Rhizopus microsporus var. microsporus]|nr:ARM repeat-containing protein [Rhizopus microsporus var. microsporus]
MQPTYIPPHGRKSPSRNDSSSAPQPNNSQNNDKNWQNNQYYPSSTYYGSNYSGQTFVRPPTGNKAIPIINPNNREIVQPPAASKDQEKPSSPIRIVDPTDQEKADDVDDNKADKQEREETVESKDVQETAAETNEANEIPEKKDDIESKVTKDASVEECTTQQEEPKGETDSKKAEPKEEIAPKEETESKDEAGLEQAEEKKDEEEQEEQKPVEEKVEVCKGDRIIYDIAFMMKFRDYKALPADINMAPFEDINTERSGNDRGGRSMSRRQTSERGRGPRAPGLAGEGMLRSGSSRGPRRQDSSGPGSPMDRQGSNRNRSSRGGKSRRAPKESREDGKDSVPSTPVEEVAPLQKSQNRWVPKVQSSETAEAKEEPELISQDMIKRKVKSLLNKLTLEKFDSISNQIWEFAKQSEKEDDSESLKTVIDLIFDKACDEPPFASMWAQLCKRLYELTSNNKEIKNVNILDKNNEVVCGGPLFRKYLLNRCQADFEKGWKHDLPKIDENDPNVMLTDEYYAAVKAKRRGLGLVKFIGELFKLQMLTDRVMKECLRTLCSDPKNPEDEETETMCKLLMTMGKVFDTSSLNNKQWLDVYFARMKEMYESKTLSSRVKFMILDVIDLRKSKWTLKRGNEVAPTTIAQIHEAAKKESEEKEKETMKRSGSSRSLGTPISRQGSSRNLASHSR